MTRLLALILLLLLTGCVAAPPPPTFEQRMAEMARMSQMLQTMRAPAPAPAPDPPRAQPAPEDPRLSILESIVRELQGQLLELRGLVRDLVIPKEE